MAEFKIGDLVFLRSNTSYNINVETGKSALLIPGIHSCEKDEMNTKLICIIPIFKKEILVERYNSDYGFRKQKEIHNMIRVMSTDTRKVYDIDADWSDVIKSEDEYNERREFQILDNAIQDKFLDLCDEIDEYMGY
mgnify:FL=1